MFLLLVSFSVRATQLRSIFLFKSCSAFVGAVQILDFSVVRQINFPPSEEHLHRGHADLI
jgi:hypothetical protein